MNESHMVDILMATYNGGKYIETQVLSIISQTFKDWRLIIHDDGSKDDTLEILKKWCRIDSRISIIDDGVICGGAALNFMHLLKYSAAEYVMFCDQDDIWFDNKIKLMYQVISSMDGSAPRVVYSNSYAWHPNDGIKGLATLKYATHLRDLLFMNSGVQGCVALFDARVRDYMNIYSGFLSMHDHLLHLIAVSLSSVCVKNVPLMLYRYHDNNVTGDTKTRLFDMSIIKNKKVPIVDNDHYETVKRFRLIYEQFLGNDEKKIIDVYLALPRKSFVCRMFLMLRNRFKLYNSTGLLLIKSFLRPYKI